jgi:phospholipase C
VVRVPVADLVVQGPNRFWYELSGSATVDVMFRDGSLELVNYGRSTVTLRAHALRYTTRTSTVRLRPDNVAHSTGRQTMAGMTWK